MIRIVRNAVLSCVVVIVVTLSLPDLSAGVEGVSMGQTQRSEFGSIISRSDGNFAPLLEQMRHAVAQRS